MSPLPPADSGFDRANADCGYRVTVGSLFREQVLLGPGRPAVEDGRRRLSYYELNERVNRLVQVMVRRGVVRGDCVAVLSENRSEYVETMFAAAKLGVLVACLNWRLADGELAQCCMLADPRLVFHSERLAATTSRLGLEGGIAFGDEYERALAGAEDSEPPDVADAEDGLIIIYTSGTTGLPKGAVISQRAEIMRAMLGRIEPVPVAAEDGFIAWSPMFHVSGTDHVIAALLRGGKVTVMDGFDGDRLIDIAAREKIAHMTVLPGVVDRVIAALVASGRRPLSVRSVGVLADLVPPVKIAELTSLVGAPYCNSFGASECGWPPASRAVIPVGEVPKSLSKLQSSYGMIRLVDEDDNDVPVGVPGEICYRGPTLFSGYLRAPDANREALRGGWFHLGDVLRRNEDGTLDFVDRRKYLIKSGGENIYPAEIEKVLIALPGVAEAVVVRKADDRWGEVPVAFIALGANGRLTAEEAVAACRSRIASYKVPKEVRFIAETELRRSTSGKIIRRDLELLLEREVAQAAREAS
ncbi:MAG TPA: AMP-binding protein [Rhizobiaceae bacterium]|nr:AMP-binding protein [Rhizobiaceae bacterium]